MAKFEKSKFFDDGLFLTYEGRFVARFKYGGKAGFIPFLIKNFTVEEYFEQIDARVPPLKILEAKGFVPANVKKILKSQGYEQTQAGFKKYLEDAANRRSNV